MRIAPNGKRKMTSVSVASACGLGAGTSAPAPEVTVLDSSRRRRRTAVVAAPLLHVCNDTLSNGSLMHGEAQRVIAAGAGPFLANDDVADAFLLGLAANEARFWPDDGLVVEGGRLRWGGSNDRRGRGEDGLRGRERGVH